MLTNLQRKSEVVRGDGKTLEVFKIWDTIQGEGPYAGEPAVFIRLGGCNLQCPLCDTEYTKGVGVMTIADIKDLVDTIMPESWGGRLVVITGGEPFRQPLEDLVMKLRFIDCTVQIETNGTLYQPEFPWDEATVVCSPKTMIHPEMRARVDAFKYVLEAGQVSPEDGLPFNALGCGLPVARPANNWRHTGQEIFVQPLDEQDPIRNQAHLKTALNSCLTFGYRLGIQLHKLIGVE